MSADYSNSLYRSFEKYVSRAKTLFPEYGEVDKSGLSWIKSILKTDTNLILKFNIFCLNNHVNSIFCNRYNILDFRQKLAIKGIPHNITFIHDQNNPIDSS